MSNSCLLFFTTQYCVLHGQQSFLLLRVPRCFRFVGSTQSTCRSVGLCSCWNVCRMLYGDGEDIIILCWNDFVVCQLLFIGQYYIHVHPEQHKHDFLSSTHRYTVDMTPVDSIIVSCEETIYHFWDHPPLVDITIRCFFIHDVQDDKQTFHLRVCPYIWWTDDYHCSDSRSWKL